MRLPILIFGIDTSFGDQMTENKGKFEESEVSDENGSELPFLISEIGSRISEISRYSGKKGFAAKAHISESHLYRYISGKSDPTASRLVAMAKAAGVRPGWLLTGELPMRQGDHAKEEVGSYRVNHSAGTGKVIAPDFDALEELIAKARTMFKTRGLNLKPEAEAKVIRLIYEYYCRNGDAMDEATIDNVIQLAAFR